MRVGRGGCSGRQAVGAATTLLLLVLVVTLCAGAHVNTRGWDAEGEGRAGALRVSWRGVSKGLHGGAEGLRASDGHNAADGSGGEMKRAALSQGRRGQVYNYNGAEQRAQEWAMDESQASEEEHWVGREAEAVGASEENWSWNVESLSTTERVVAGIIVAIFAIFGVFECFYGFRFVHLVVSLFGFVFGFLLTYVFIVNVIISSHTGEYIAVGVGAAVGIVLALMAWAWYLSGVFLLGGGLGIGIALVLQDAVYSWLVDDGTLSTILFWVTLPVLFLVTGALTLCNQKLFIVIGTAFSGAVLFIGGIHFSFFKLIITNPPSWTSYLVYMRIVLAAVMAGAGATVQYLVTTRVEEDDYSPLEL
eukprot:TRINITY_DN26259_c0_g1_i1.p1 TRINITY_DN26259_c0_g1~~TRINITY_DN26259_c0_g1_i1.p1  ORF type:complete len:362 (-),score=119.16 TRINITY_DN26259_c0_g1_i1:105-1190(-)